MGKKMEYRLFKKLHFHQSILLDNVVNGNINNGGSGTFILNANSQAKTDDYKRSDSNIPDHESLEVNYIWEGRHEIERNIEENQHAKLSSEDKEIVATIRRAVIAYRKLERNGKEAELDNAFHVNKEILRKIGSQDERVCSVVMGHCWDISGTLEFNFGHNVGHRKCTSLRVGIDKKTSVKMQLLRYIEQSVNGLDGLRSVGPPVVHRKKLLMIGSCQLEF
ncbi:18167_t:CDS:2 [Funneliformis geosporum]|nr:18167_t:CDS:2 [Funneliformis geosporum]